MDVNEIARAAQKKTQEEWTKRLCSIDTDFRHVYDLAASFRTGHTCSRAYDETGLWVRKGAYNMCFWAGFEDGTKWVVRLPIVGAIAPELVDEKLKTEIATMMFLREKTTVPVPALIGYGLTGNNRHPLGLAFLVMEHVPGKALPLIWDTLSDLDKRVIYDQIAAITLQLNSYHFEKIGALTLDDDGNWTTGNRPLTHALAGLQLDGIEVRMRAHYNSALDYFLDYFSHHRRRFLEQPNSTDEMDDAREKYAGLFIFESLILQFLDRENNCGPFVLSHGDLHGPNLMIDNDLQIVAVLDWEWSAIVPLQVACLPPVCLSTTTISKLAQGEGMQSFVEAVGIFLSCHQERERRLRGCTEMTGRMRNSLTNGTFWFGHAIQNIYTFEYLFWDNIFPYAFAATEEVAIESVLNSPMHRNAQEILRGKMAQYDEYQKQLSNLKVQLPET